MSPFRIIFRIAAAVALILFFLMTYEPAHCQTPKYPLGRLRQSGTKIAIYQNSSNSFHISIDGKVDRGTVFPSFGAK
jgi:hypothetical protein